jgi:hypothetical protein
MIKDRMTIKNPLLSLLLITIFLVTLNKLSAQETKVVQDLHLWTGAGIEKSIGKAWTLSLKEEIRFKHDINEINNYFTDAGLRYEINKNFALEGAYRYTRDKKSDNSYENLTRFNLDLRYKGRLDFITIHYRLRYQKEVEGFNLIVQGTDYEKYVRNRIRIYYNDFKNFKPYVSAELFRLFKYAQASDLEYIRVQGGVKYEPGSLGSFLLAFGFNRELISEEPAMIYMLKLNYTYEF